MRLDGLAKALDLAADLNLGLVAVVGAGQLGEHPAAMMKAVLHRQRILAALVAERRVVQRLSTQPLGPGHNRKLRALGDLRPLRIQADTVLFAEAAPAVRGRARDTHLGDCALKAEAVLAHEAVKLLALEPSRPAHASPHSSSFAPMYHSKRIHCAQSVKRTSQC